MRKLLLALSVAAAVAGAPAMAGSFEDGLVAQLHAQGFPEVEVSTTLLGRVRLVATSATHWREIIVNPRTGEILRDYSELISGEEEAQVAPILMNPNSGSSGSTSGSGSSGSNSGSGSSGSNSGSGSSGSHSGSGSSGSNSGSGSSGSGGSSDDD